jgi:hypothetical protein
MMVLSSGIACSERGIASLTGVAWSFHKWRAARKERKLAKYTDELGHMDRSELQRLREQQSPLRGRGSPRRFGPNVPAGRSATIRAHGEVAEWLKAAPC